MTVQGTIRIDLQQLPQSPVTAADVVGRAFRITRLNWWPLIRLFAVPSFLYSLAGSCVSWLGKHTELGVGIFIVGAAVDVILLVVSRCWVYELTYALLLVICGHIGGIDLARREAAKKRALILLLISPIVMADVGILVIFAVSEWISGLPGIDHKSHVLQSSIVMGGAILVSMPLECLALLLALFVAILVAERLKMLECCVRSAYLVWHAVGYVSAYITGSLQMHFFNTSILQCFTDLTHERRDFVRRSFWNGVDIDLLRLRTTQRHQLTQLR
jgi:hypothetical protein